jgi:diguanylate cyclase (GGDEF)-like protein
VLGDAPDANRDRVERAVSATVLARLRAEDTAGHLGGLRFAVLAPEADATGAVRVAENVVEVVHTKMQSLGYEEGQFQVAVGWAAYPDDADSRPGLLSQAQNNLEAAALRGQARSAA